MFSDNKGFIVSYTSKRNRMITRKMSRTDEVKIANENTEQVTVFKCLGCLVREDQWRSAVSYTHLSV